MGVSGFQGLVLGAAIATLSASPALGITPTPLVQDLAAVRAKEQLEPGWEQVAQGLIDGYRQRRPVPWSDRKWLPEHIQQIRDRFLRALEQDHGAPIGYKAALVNPAVRSRFNAANPSFNATTPIRGVLFANMLRPSGTPIPISIATRPLVEGDILVRVGDGEALRQARTDDEILAALDAVIPFIEVPDLIYSAESSIDVRAIAVANAGARSGWVGYPIPMTLQQWQTLSQVPVQMTVRTHSATTTRTVPLGKGLGMEPAAVVRWLRDGLRDELRENLKRGDILSLGTLLPPQPAQPG
ncbi:MAG: hypothetical protein AAGF75_08335, partial [Cyanobacteria bacterium P01_H01_bin.130]